MLEIYNPLIYIITVEIKRYKSYVQQYFVHVLHLDMYEMHPRNVKRKEKVSLYSNEEKEGEKKFYVYRNRCYHRTREHQLPAGLI